MDAQAPQSSERLGFVFSELFQGLGSKSGQCQVRAPWSEIEDGPAPKKGREIPEWSEEEELVVIAGSHWF